MGYFEEVVDGFGDKSILDIGCGGGILTEEFAKRGGHVTGIDSSYQSLVQAKAHARENELEIDYRVGNASALSFPDHAFDIVVASEVLEHIGNLDTALWEMARVLKPGGLFLFDTPNRTWLSWLYFIAFGEILSRRIPRGTHDARMFIRPEELTRKLLILSIRVKDIRGYRYYGRGADGRHQFRFSRSPAVAYFGWGTKE
jgi:2-polyprenyl-6-hydroxyphenyl methylase/3-demethylubiquinone-9 3-methyltransferase